MAGGTRYPRRASRLGREAAVIDFLSDAFRRNPFPVYRQLQARFPVLHLPKPWNAWLIFDYESVRRVLDDHETFSSRLLAPDTWFSFLDPPAHTTLRALVSTAFTPEATRRLEADVRRLSSDLLDRLTGRRDVDLAAEFSVPLTMRVIADLIGIPSHDWETFKRWSDAILMLSYNVPGRASARIEREFAAVSEEMRVYISARLGERGSARQDDLLTRLSDATIDGERLSLDQVLGTVQILLVGGQSTISDLINNAVLCLIEFPDQLRRLRADRALLTPAIEEVLRYRSPVQLLIRTPRRAVEFHGRIIPAGALVVPVLGAANRDPTRFADPDRFDISRTPNPHVAFGHGIHFCFGAALSRLEGRIAIADLLDRFAEFALASRRPWRPRPALHVHGPISLPLRV